MPFELKELKLPDLRKPYEDLDEAIEDILSRLCDAIDSIKDPKSLTADNTVSKSKARAFIYDKSYEALKHEAQQKRLIQRLGLHGFIEAHVKMTASALGLSDEEDMQDRVAELQDRVNEIYESKKKLLKTFKNKEGHPNNQNLAQRLWLASGGETSIGPKITINHDEAILGFKDGTQQVAHFLRACAMKDITHDPHARNSQKTKTGLTELKLDTLRYLETLDEELPQEDPDKPSP